MFLQAVNLHSKLEQEQLRRVRSTLIKSTPNQQLQFLSTMHLKASALTLCLCAVLNSVEVAMASHGNPNQGVPGTALARPLSSASAGPSDVWNRREQWNQLPLAGAMPAAPWNIPTGAAPMRWDVVQAAAPHTHGGPSRMSPQAAAWHPDQTRKEALQLDVTRYLRDKSAVTQRVSDEAFCAEMCGAHEASLC